MEIVRNTESSYDAERPVLEDDPDGTSTRIFRVTKDKVVGGKVADIEHPDVQAASIVFEENLGTVRLPSLISKGSIRAKPGTDLTVTGPVTAQHDIVLAGNAILKGAAASMTSQRGSISIDGHAAVAGTITAEGSIYIDGALAANNARTVTGHILVKQGLHIPGSVECKGDLRCERDVTILGKTAVDGDVQVGGRLTATRADITLRPGRNFFARTMQEPEKKQVAAPAEAQDQPGHRLR